jgi:hypothetical protein
MGLGLAMAAGPAAVAMTLVVQKGPVLLNQGDGYRPVTGTVDVAAGNSVVVQGGGAAELICSGDRRWKMDVGYYPVPEDCGAAPPQQIQGYIVGAGAVAGATMAIEASRDQDKPARDE